MGNRTNMRTDVDERAFDCVVVGAGVNGLAAARAAAMGGARTALVEQFVLNHDHGSSHGDSRSFRHYPAAEWMSLWREAEPLWGELEEESGSELLRRVGLVAHGGDLRSERESLVSLGVPATKANSAEIAARYGIRLPDAGDAYVDPTAGFILAARARDALAASCANHGVTTVERVTITALSPSATGISLSTTGRGASPGLAK